MAINLLTPLKRKITIYSDFQKNMENNPISNDLALKQDEEAVKDSLKNLILTNKGERLFQPNLGSDVSKSLFDLMTPATLKVLEESVRSTINNYEPRANLLNVDLRPDPDNYRVEIVITFYVRNTESPVTVSVFLERTR